MAALRAAGLPFEAVEAHSRVGGIWDVQNPLSSVYEGMCTVTSRYTTHLGEPAPESCPNYLPHAQAHAYLEQFAEREQLLPHVRLSTRFISAEKSERGTWQATFRSGEARETGEYRGIVFATGAHHRELGKFPPQIREQALAAGIEVLHSSDYEQPQRFAGRRVLIVGVGNSGSDIADKISKHAARTLLAIRTPPWINPQTVFGIPCDKLAADTPAWMPNWYRLSSFHLIRWLKVGGFRRLGLRTPRHGLNDRLPIGDRGIVEAIRSGRVQVRSDVAGLEGGIVRFQNAAEESEPVDVVIFATGFHRRYPLLDAADAAGPCLSGALSWLVFHRREPALAYLAEAIGFRGCWPVFTDQARAVAAYFKAAEKGGKHVREFDARRAAPSPNFKGQLFARADGFHVDYDIYSQALRELADWLAE